MEKSKNFTPKKFVLQVWKIIQLFHFRYLHIRIVTQESVIWNILYYHSSLSYVLQNRERELLLHLEAIIGPTAEL